ncbi:c-type cytochrome [Sulfuricurvum sp.]|uniref:c-type cytochrome n=1 Tax=Sulfuricurvum sp. TaxID=2025608 RepID=UPI002E3049EE|nr:c-type cytochrome [Sulfuricurvum sp.]HEX5329996.1 c-type cytochrome [Sulfuricurvum sp.]
MKLFAPILCSFLLIGCSDSKPTEAPVTSETTAPIEVNQTASIETNASVSTPPVTATPSTPVAVETAAIDASALFAQKCVSCHGAKAEKAALNKSQIIANFNEAQVKEALKGYQNGTYGKEMKALMQGQAKGLNDAQIDALAKYISTL